MPERFDSPTERGSRGPRCHAVPALLGLVVLALLMGCGESVDDQLAAVRDLHDQGRPADAIPILRQVLEKDLEHPEANYLLGVSHIGNGQAALSIWPLRRALASEDPVAPEAGLLLANVLVNTGDYEEAIKAADEVLRKDPERASARLLRAQAHLDLKDWEAALDDTTRLVDEMPGDFSVLLIRTRALAELERFDQAEEEVRKAYDAALEQAPTHAPRTCAALASFEDEYRLDRAAAREQIELCLERHPEDKWVLEWAVWLHDASGMKERGDELLAAATTRAPENLEFWKMRAERLVRDGKAEEADRVLLEAAELIDSPQAWQILAELRRAVGDETGAVQAMARGIEAAGSDESLAFAKADLLVSAGELEEARALAATFTETSHRSFVTGRILEAEGDLEGALEAFEEGLLSWPDNAGARFNAGLLAEELGRWQQALSHYREATRAAPEQTDAALRMTNLLIRLGEFRAAYDFAVRHAKNRPLTGDLYAAGARAALMSGDYEEAEKIYGELIAGLGDPIGALLGLAAVAREREGPAAAVELIEAEDLDWADPDTERVLAALADDLAALEEFDRALAFLDSALASRPGDPALLNIRGRALLAAGRLEAAESAFAAALEAAPGFGPALAGKASLAARAGDVEGAIVLFDQASSAEASDSEAAYMAAQLTILAGRRDEAERRLREILRYSPEHGAAANDLAWLLADDGRELEWALELAKRAVRLMRTADAYDTLGTVHMRSGSPQAAMRFYRQALEEKPDSPATRYRLGLALDAAGKREEALEAFREAVSEGSFAEEEEARSQIARLESELGEEQ